MGNRAVVTFETKPTSNSVGVYLHWNGGKESIVPFVKALDRYGVRDGQDGTYQLARFIQLIGNFFGGTLSLGVGNLRKLDINGDNGLYVVNRIKGETVITRSMNGLKGPFEVIDQDAAMAHDYNTGDVNLALFKKD